VSEDFSRRKADLIVAEAREHKISDEVLLDMNDLSSVADYFFICSCRSTRQVQAVTDHVVEQVKKKGGYRPLGVEGQKQGNWVLIDYGDVVAHVFYQPYREMYDLESLWIEAARIRLSRPESDAQEVSGGQ
jgi:ribosome-associated protein